MTMHLDPVWFAVVVQIIGGIWALATASARLAALDKRVGQLEVDTRSIPEALARIEERLRTIDQHVASRNHERDQLVRDVQRGAPGARSRAKR